MLFKTRSKRRRGETPYAVALRRNVGLKFVIGQAGDLVLRQLFGPAVWRHRIEASGLIYQVFTGCPVDTARRGEDESGDTRLPGRRRKPNRGTIVDLVGQFRVKVAQRIVRQASQVDDRLEPLELFNLDVPDIPAQRGDIGGSRPERREAEQVTVKTGDLVPRLLEQRRQPSPDVSSMPCH